MPPISREYLQQMTYVPSKRTKFVAPLAGLPHFYFILFLVLSGLQFTRSRPCYQNENLFADKALQAAGK